MSGGPTWTRRLTRLEAARRVLGRGPALRWRRRAPCCTCRSTSSLEPSLDPELRSWLAFATQRLEEVRALVRGLNEGREAIEEELAGRRRRSLPGLPRRGSTTPPSPGAWLSTTRRWSSGSVLTRCGSGSRRHTWGSRELPDDHYRLVPPDAGDPVAARPVPPGRASTRPTYEAGMRAYIDEAVAFQEEIGLDVLVHGEPERNDMVEYFGELLERLRGDSRTAGCRATARAA